MFTGIVEEVGRVRHISPNGADFLITVEAGIILEDISLGDSIAVDGVCLTARSIDKDCFTADVSTETMRMTSIGSYRPGRVVNLERALQSGGRFGGHMVSGHVDGTGSVKGVTKDKGWLLEVEVEESLSNFMIYKGSVTVSGVSLTIASLSATRFTVAIIPHTALHTTIQFLKPGDAVNVECDMIAKYVEKLLHPFVSKKSSSSGLTKKFLAENGLM